MGNDAGPELLQAHGALFSGNDTTCITIEYFVAVPLVYRHRLQQVLHPEEVPWAVLVLLGLQLDTHIFPVLWRVVAKFETSLGARRTAEAGLITPRNHMRNRSDERKNGRVPIDLKRVIWQGGAGGSTDC
ncbi:hypothetical protein E2562_006721 [Oryza meyeriana var. granulata]|uniref:Uncharacterized protein n=1 Tax=Oryza meyeriana var. granulata TaxID=110450 RepID=A0A6G1EG20_9ORYZ|nr:hypothetical protein E2562_006721 [Oryza meyeriana var. granulata]